MSQTKSSTSWLYLISTLATIGAAISIWQTRLYYITRSGMGEMHSFCNIGQAFDCTAVEMSKFSELLPSYPVAAFAIAGYRVIAILAFMGSSSETFQKNVRSYLVTFTGIALLFSVGYFIVMISVIGKLCLLCLTVDAINLVLFILSLRLPKNQSGATGIKLTHLASVGLASLLVSFLLTKSLNPQADLKTEDMNDVVESVLATPSVPVEIPSDAPVIGDPDAKVTIVKYSDYECPACRMAANAIHPLFKRYSKGVKFVFVNYPLDQACNPDIPRKMHEFACEAAEVAICGSNQGKFLETYETLFEHQQDFSAGKVANLMQSVPGIDMAKLKECMTLPSTGEKLRRDIAMGGKGHMNIQSTPTFYANGKKIEGGLATNMWVQVIDRLLKQ
jgi:protein-disulfide isomerase/uncharacterized membrane protein